MYGTIDGFAKHQKKVKAVTDLTLMQQRANLLLAQRELDMRFRARFSGQRPEMNQGEAWPRIGAVDAKGSPLSHVRVPECVEQAGYEVASAISEGVEPDWENVEATLRPVLVS